MTVPEDLWYGNIDPHEAIDRQQAVQASFAFDGKEL